MVRKWGGFESKQDPDAQWLAGIFIERTSAPADHSVAAFNPFASRMALMFPQGDGRARFYFGARSTEPGMTGEKDVPRFIEESVKAGMSRNTSRERSRLDRWRRSQERTRGWSIRIAMGWR